MDEALFVREASPELGEDLAVHPVPRLTRGSWRIRGQVANTYIVCEDDDGLILVDQHAAHERVIYEALRRDLSRGHVATQDLLVPQALDLPLAFSMEIGQIRDWLAGLGFHIEPFGPGRILVRAVPSYGGELLTADALVEIIEAAMEDRGQDQSGIWDRVLCVVSCRAAVMAGDGLAVPEMEKLIEDVSSLDAGATCPHGRPVAVRFAYEELERLFGRR